MTRFIVFGFTVLSLCLASCASMEESIEALRAIHKPHPNDSILVDRARYGMSMTYAQKIDDEEIEDPVDFCLSHIEVIAESNLESAIKKYIAVHTLALVACRSPAVKVRLSAVRSIRSLYENPPIDYRLDAQSDEPDRFEEQYKRMLELFHEGRVTDRPPEAWENEILPLLVYFQNHKPTRFDLWWQVVDDLFAQAPIETFDEETLGTYEEAARILNAQLTLITAHLAKLDPDEQVRQEAIELFFLFPWDTVRFYLPDWVDYLQSPPHRIKIMTLVREKQDRPTAIDLTIVSLANKVLLRYMSAGELYHAILLLQTFTGTQEKEPDFWAKWCKQYLLEHAGDAGKPGPDSE
ncbi:MAG: hypothetical protein ABIK28_21750 [Planctomycetota bacterium]